MAASLRAAHKASAKATGLPLCMHISDALRCTIGSANNQIVSDLTPNNVPLNQNPTELSDAILNILLAIKQAIWKTRQKKPRGSPQWRAPGELYDLYRAIPRFDGNLPEYEAHIHGLNEWSTKTLFCRMSLHYSQCVRMVHTESSSFKIVMHPPRA